LTQGNFFVHSISISCLLRVSSLPTSTFAFHFVEGALRFTSL
jgi:hypothetical protein